MKLLLILIFFSSPLCLAVGENLDANTLMGSIKNLQGFKAYAATITNGAAIESQKLNSNVTITDGKMLSNLSAFYQLETIQQAITGDSSKIALQHWQNFSTHVKWDPKKIDIWSPELNRFFNKLERNTKIAEWAPFIIRYFNSIPPAIFSSFGPEGQLKKCQFYFQWYQFELATKCYGDVEKDLLPSDLPKWQPELFVNRVRGWIVSDKPEDIVSWTPAHKKSGMLNYAYMVQARMTGKYDDALKYYELAISKLPPRAVTLRKIADNEYVRAQALKMNYAEAKKKINESLSKTKTQKKSAQAEADYLFLSFILVLEKKWDESYKNLQEAARLQRPYEELRLRLKRSFFSCAISVIIKKPNSASCEEETLMTSDLKTFSGTDWVALDMLAVMRALKKPKMSPADKKTVVDILADLRSRKPNETELIIVLDEIIKNS